MSAEPAPDPPPAGDGYRPPRPGPGAAFAYGWRRGPAGAYEPDPAEQDAIRLARAARAAGATWDGVAAALAAAGVRTRRGRSFTAERCRRAFLAHEARPAAPRTGRSRPIRRARTLAGRLAPAERLELGRLESDYAAHREARPRTWGECAGSADPCPWVSCAWHLALDVSPRTGSVKVNLPAAGDPTEIDWGRVRYGGCALRAAARGGLTLDAAGAAAGLTRERVRQLESAILAKLRAGGVGVEALRAYGEDADPRPSLTRRRYVPGLRDE